MMTSSRPKVGDIWLAWVEFSDRPGTCETRPVVVVDVRSDACVAIAAKITSKDLRTDGSGRCLPILDWRDCGLRKPSYIRLDQRFELPFEERLREKPIGTLPDSYLAVVAAELKKF